MIQPRLFFLLKIALAIRGLLRGWVSRQAFRKYILVISTILILPACTCYEAVGRTLHVFCDTPKKCIT